MYKIFNYKLLLPIFLCGALITGTAGSRVTPPIKASEHAQSFKLYTTDTKLTKKAALAEKARIRKAERAEKARIKKAERAEKKRILAEKRKAKKLLITKKRLEAKKRAMLKRQARIERKKQLLAAKKNKKAASAKKNTKAERKAKSAGMRYKPAERRVISAERDILRNAAKSDAISVVPGLGIFMRLSGVATGTYRESELLSIFAAIELISQQSLNQLANYYASGLNGCSTTVHPTSIEIRSLPETDKVIVFLQSDVSCDLFRLAPQYDSFRLVPQILTSQNILSFGAMTWPSGSCHRNGMFFTKGTTVGNYTFSEDCTLRADMPVDEFLNTLAKLTNGKKRPLGTKK